MLFGYNFFVLEIDCPCCDVSVCCGMTRAWRRSTAAASPWRSDIHTNSLIYQGVSELIDCLKIWWSGILSPERFFIVENCEAMLLVSLDLLLWRKVLQIRLVRRIFFRIRKSKLKTRSKLTLLQCFGSGSRGLKMVKNAK